MEEVTSADSAIYRDLMRFKPDGWTANAWAVNAGVSRTVWTDMRRHGNPSRRTLEKLLSAAGSSLAEFEALRIGDAAPPAGGSGGSLSDSAAPAWRSGSLQPLPLIASRPTGQVVADGKRVEATELDAAAIVDQLQCPATLAADRDAYAFTIVGEAMWPRFRPGRRVVVSPAADPAVGDDVVVAIRRDSTTGVALVVLGELIKQSAGAIHLRQFNPDIVYSIAAGRAVAIHKIVGELI